MQFFVKLQYYKQQSARKTRKISEVTSSFGAQLERSILENDSETTRVEVANSLNEVTEFDDEIVK